MIQYVVARHYSARSPPHPRNGLVRSSTQRHSPHQSLSHAGWRSSCAQAPDGVGGARAAGQHSTDEGTVEARKRKQGPRQGVGLGSCRPLACRAQGRENTAGTGNAGTRVRIMASSVRRRRHAILSRQQQHQQQRKKKKQQQRKKQATRSEPERRTRRARPLDAPRSGRGKRRVPARRRPFPLGHLTAHRRQQASRSRTRSVEAGRRMRRGGNRTRFTDSSG